MGVRFILLTALILGEYVPGAHADIRYRVRGAMAAETIRVAATHSAVLEDSLRSYLDARATPDPREILISEEQIDRVERHFYEMFGPELRRWPERLVPITLGDGVVADYLGLTQVQPLLDFSSAAAPSFAQVFAAIRDRVGSEGSRWVNPIDQMVFRFAPGQFPVSRAEFRNTIEAQIRQRALKTRRRQWTQNQFLRRFRSRLFLSDPLGGMLAPRATREDRQQYLLWLSQQAPRARGDDIMNLSFVVVSWPSPPSDSEKIRVRTALQGGADPTELGLRFRREHVHVSPENQLPIAVRWRSQELRTWFDQQQLPWAYWDAQSAEAWVLEESRLGLEQVSAAPSSISDASGISWAETRWRSALLRVLIVEWATEARIELLDFQPGSSGVLRLPRVSQWVQEWLPAIGFRSQGVSVDSCQLPSAENLLGVLSIDLFAWERVFAE